MDYRKLLMFTGIIGILSGCAGQVPESQQMLVKENPPISEESTNNLVIPPSLVNKTNTENKADAEPAPITAANNKACNTKGKQIMVGALSIGISIEQGYCDANLKPEGSQFWIPESEKPVLGNISVDDQCNITYCPTSQHYDHFGITDGENSIQVQIRWQNNQATIN